MGLPFEVELGLHRRGRGPVARSAPEERLQVAPLLAVEAVHEVAVGGQAEPRARAAEVVADRGNEAARADVAGDAVRARRPAVPAERLEAVPGGLDPAAGLGAG